MSAEPIAKVKARIRDEFRRSIVVASHPRGFEAHGLPLPPAAPPFINHPSGIGGTEEEAIRDLLEVLIRDA